MDKDWLTVYSWDLSKCFSASIQYTDYSDLAKKVGMTKYILVQDKYFNIVVDGLTRLRYSNNRYGKVYMGVLNKQSSLLSEINEDEFTGYLNGYEFSNDMKKLLDNE